MAFPDLTPAEIAKALEAPANQPRLAARYVEQFNAQELANVIEQEIRQCYAAGLSHIGINMNLVDAAMLAQTLKDK